MKSVMIIYLLLLGMAIGVEVAVGAFIAPVIFYPHTFLGQGVLSHFQSGILMTQVFLKSNMLFLIVAIYSVLFESFSWFIQKRRERISFSLAFLSLGLTVLFVWYYTPYIVEAQLQGALATTTEYFHTMHKQSEWVMKALLLVQGSLFFRRMWVLQKGEKK